MKLSSEDISIISRIKSVRRVSLSSGRYYVKEVRVDWAVNELVGMKFAQKLGIKCAQCQIVNINDDYYCLSLDLAEGGVFKIGREFVSKHELNNLYDIWISLDKNFNNAESLMYDFIKLYIMDLFVLNSDRRAQNWGVQIKDGQNTLCAFDNEMLFNIDDRHYINSELDEVWDSDVKKRRLTDISDFLRFSSAEFRQLFVEIYRILTPDFFLEVLREIAMEYDLTYIDVYKYLTIYDDNYNDITKILKKEELLENGR